MLDITAAAALAACALEISFGAILPGPAEGGAELRHTEVHCSLTPAVAKPGDEAALTVRLTPRAGATWHEARLVPDRVEVLPAAGWSAEVSELALPPAESPTGPREFTVRLRAGGERGGHGVLERDEEGTGRDVLELRVRYGVRLPVSQEARHPPAQGPPEAGERNEKVEEKAPASPGPVPVEVIFKVIFEEATLAVELPAALPAAAVPAADTEEGGVAGPPLPEGVGALPGAEGPDDGRASPDPLPEGHPALPALFLALAAAAVFVGLAFWIRAKR